MPQPRTQHLHDIKRHALWVLVAFFLALSYFAAINLREKVEERRNAVLISAWTETSVAFSELIHELQKERGMSSGFIASSGSKFRHEIGAQRRATDAAAALLQKTATKLPKEADVLARLSFGSLTEVDGLVALRQGIDELRMSREATVDRYSQAIDHMFDHLLATMSVGQVGWIIRRQMAFVFFLQAKEMAGQERALITAMLANADFGPLRLNAYHRIKAVEQSSIDSFLQLSEPEATTRFQDILRQPYAAQAERIRRLIVAVGASGEKPQISLPRSELWFALASEKIDAMSAFERSLSDHLMNSARTLEAQAWRALVVNALTILASFALAGVLMVQIWRGKELAEKNLHLAAEVFDNSVESIIIADAGANIIDVNPAFSRISGYGRAEVLGQNPRLFKSGRHDRKFYEAMWDKLLRSGSWEGEIWNRRKNGSLYPALLSIATVKDGRGAISHFIAMTVDLSKFKETEKLLEELRTFDPLTGLPNREAWHSAMDQAVANARRTAGRFAVLDIGLDRFKTINESFGHAVGDEVLVAAAEAIKRQVRRHDVAARPSGNHFSILLNDLSDPGEIGTYCESLLAAFAQPLNTSAQSFSQSISIGIALFPGDGTETRGLLQNAESALHAARDQGGASYAFYSKEMNSAGAKLLALEQMMRQALERGELSVVYQPQVDARNSVLVGVEALLRWHNPQLGPISPVQFIPIAETTGLIVPIGEWVLRESCRQAQAWRTEFGAEVPVAVNLSARQFVREDLMTTVQQALDASGLPARLLELEITEGLLMNDPAGAADIMRGLRAMGLKLALDDFGTGYSSLAYLKTFPLDRLKLDRAFVIDLAESKDDRAIANTVVSLGHHLEMQVLAEGVETAAQRDYLASIGCDIFQGYLFGKPMKPEDLAAAVRDGRLCLPPSA